MRRRRLLWLVGIAVLGVVLWPRPAHRITRENVLRIELGMSEQEVNDLLRVPAGNYHPRGKLLALSSNLPAGTPKVWVGDELGLAVWFDEDRRITQKQVAMVCQDRTPLVAAVRGWLSRWRR